MKKFLIGIMVVSVLVFIGSLIFIEYAEIDGYSITTYSTNCRESNRIDIMLDDGRGDISIFDDYCEDCGSSMKDDLMIYRESCCSSCDEHITSNYCKDCGGQVTEGTYVSLKDVGITLSMLRAVFVVGIVGAIALILAILLVFGFAYDVCHPEENILQIREE